VGLPLPDKARTPALKILLVIFRPFDYKGLHEDRRSVTDMAEDRSIKALVVEGGAMRGVFSTGVLDGFLESGFNPFDLFIGVSSGASNLAAYLARMHGRNARIYLDYSLRPEFLSYRRFIAGGHLLDLDWMWDATIRDIRLDLLEIYSRRLPFIAVLTDVMTGSPIYRLTAASDLEQTLKASSAMPLVYRGFPLVEGRPFTDGGLADPLPVKAAIDRGAGRIMVIRSRGKGYRKKRSPFDRLVLRHVKDYPRLKETIKRRAEVYNESVNLIRTPPGGISVVEICPPESFRVSRLTRSRSVLEEGYCQGREAAGEAMVKWSGA
jgi:predicted patatin/cPLA2 family phospholipase